MLKTSELENQIKSGQKIENQVFNSKKELKQLIKKSGCSISAINAKLGLNNYVYEILNENSQKRGSRDIIVSILILVNADILTGSRVLQGFGYSKLYVKVERDRIIYEGIVEKLSLDAINEKLIEAGFESLSKD